MSPKRFLVYGGGFLIAIAALGFIVPDIGGSLLNFDPVENWSHLGFGLFMLIITRLPIGDLKRWLSFLVGISGVIICFLGFLVAKNPPPNFHEITNLETIDNIIHGLLGLWGIAASFRR
jgi:hypothetical protein